MQHLSSSLGLASTRRAVTWQTHLGRQCLLMPRRVALPRLNGHYKSRHLLQLQASTVDAPPPTETVEAERPVAMVSNVSCVFGMH